MPAGYVLLALGRPVSRPGGHERSRATLESRDRSLGRRGGVSGTLDDCRALPHEFVLCDLLEDPRPLLERVRSEPAAVIWWSNAFFTIYSNWFFTIAERRQRYVSFINGLAETAPGLYLYGADHMNSSVNSIRADEYAVAVWHARCGRRFDTGSIPQTADSKLRARAPGE